MESVSWTEAPEEVTQFEKENTTEKMVTDYFPDNRKQWSFFAKEKDKVPVAVFTSFFDMRFFK